MKGKSETICTERDWTESPGPKERPRCLGALGTNQSKKGGEKGIGRRGAGTREKTAKKGEEFSGFQRGSNQKFF